VDRGLGLRLQLVPVTWDEINADLAARRFDIVMAGTYITDKRLENLQASDPYFESPLAFIAPSKTARQFLSYREVADAPNLVLGVLAESAIFRMCEQLFPKVRVMPLATYDDIPNHPELDGAL
jgi:ABC-type amino acid transport substrate-binding protein